MQLRRRIHLRRGREGAFSHPFDIKRRLNEALFPGPTHSRCRQTVSSCRRNLPDNRIAAHAAARRVKREYYDYYYTRRLPAIPRASPYAAREMKKK